MMLGPLPRDLHTRCCSDTEHVRDQQTAGQRVAMRDAVAKARVDLERLPVDEWLEVLQDNEPVESHSECSSAGA